MHCPQFITIATSVTLAPLSISTASYAEAHTKGHEVAPPVYVPVRRAMGDPELFRVISNAAVGVQRVEEPKMGKSAASVDPNAENTIGRRSLPFWK
jgi:hypothetical protein